MWFVTAAVPRDVLTAEPTADRGFARKYLAQLAVKLPDAGFSAPVHIGDFDMNRSTPPGLDEFYIGGYAGLSVVQTVIPGLTKLSEIPEPYMELVAAADVYATCRTPDDPSGLGGFAHWSGGTLKRAFTATRETVHEDTGLPESFEAPFWEGNEETSGIQLPFIPGKIGDAAIGNWLGFRVARDGLDIPVSAFAVDGRPAQRSRPSRPASTGSAGSAGPTGSTAATSPATKRADYDVYDDYAEAKAPSGRDTGELLRGAAGSVVTGIGHGVKASARFLRTGANKIGDEVRRRARNTGR
ncbi:MAG TPA: hypothetical protein H9870_03730 [Candidatus Corynebacterium avicola]|uniref:Uncharacterized protein n=1 Tax=Candidatus Corynebacterium avicola TaxID=2838527 RepID=A0A9D1RNB6_9CORY|nr:hypothetical protein [Candidatus Corynebacterium avicola]